MQFFIQLQESLETKSKKYYFLQLTKLKVSLQPCTIGPLQLQVTILQIINIVTQQCLGCHTEHNKFQ